MLKKLREKLYYKKTQKIYDNLMFDDFAFYGDSEFPMFIRYGYGERKTEFFIPKTDDTFNLAFGKLKNKFYENYVLDDVKNRIRVYMAHSKISEESYKYCVEMFKNKSAILCKEN